MIHEQIATVQGLFRQDETLKRWASVLAKSKFEQFPLVRCSVQCLRRMYVRGLVRDVSHILHLPCTTIDIVRTANGSFTLSND